MSTTNESHSIRAPVAHPSLADGRLSSRNAVHRRVHGVSLGDYHTLVAIHRPLGILILLLAVDPAGHQVVDQAPGVSADHAATGTLRGEGLRTLLYTLFFALPLVGWAMLSAGHYPIVMFGAVHLPPILPARPELYATLRETHTILAYLLFLTFLAHMGAVLFHTLILRDGL